MSKILGKNILFNTTTGLQLFDADASNFIALKAPAVVGANVTLTLPANDGDAGQFLQTDGAGVLSWITVSAASTALDNLAAVAINTALLPNLDNSIDFGSSLFQWADVWATGIRTNGSDFTILPDGDLLLQTSNIKRNGGSLDFSVDGSFNLNTTSGSGGSLLIDSDGDLNLSDAAGAQSSLVMDGVGGTQWTGGSGSQITLHAAGAVQIEAIDVINIDSDIDLINVNDCTIANVLDPVNPQDAATKFYVDSFFTEQINVPPSAVEPATPVAGSIYFDTVLEKLRVYNGTAWETITSV